MHKLHDNCSVITSVVAIFSKLKYLIIQKRTRHVFDKISPTLLVHEDECERNQIRNRSIVGTGQYM